MLQVLSSGQKPALRAFQVLQAVARWEAAHRSTCPHRVFAVPWARALAAAEEAVLPAFLYALRTCCPGPLGDSEAHNQHKLGKPQILCFRALFIRVFQGI